MNENELNELLQRITKIIENQTFYEILHYDNLEPYSIIHALHFRII